MSDKITDTFKSLDKDKDGLISPTELQKLLQQIKGFDKWKEEDFATFFSNADWNCDAELTFEEFVDWILEIEIPQLYSRCPGKRYPVYRTLEIIYPNGTTISLDSVVKDLEGYGEQLARENVPPVAARIRTFMRKKNYHKTLHRFFVDAEENGSGSLEWNNKEIYNFGMLCFERLELPRMGGDMVFHALYKQFDLDNSESLSERECLCMMDSVFRALAKMQRHTDPADSSDEDS